MTVIVQEPLSSEDERIQVEGGQHEKDIDQTDSENSLHLDGGFVTPESNAFGHDFRDYHKESERQMAVKAFYRTNHINQTYEFALSKREQYGKLDKCVMSIWECCELLNEYVDESDPDLDEPQIEHLLQTAEAIRRDYPNEDWLHLTGLIHGIDLTPHLLIIYSALSYTNNPSICQLPSACTTSFRREKILADVEIFSLLVRNEIHHVPADLGKVLLHPKFGEEAQWAVVGDTYPLGCAFDEAIVHHEYFMENPDYYNPKYNTKYGIYSERCGLENVIMSWGHDEYMHTVAKNNNTTLPPPALFIIRFHSFYALHRAGAYTHLMNDRDKEMLEWVKKFNKYDLYSKSKVRIDVEAVKPYYLSLIQKYFPSKLRW